jgi:hypothetical protein
MSFTTSFTWQAILVVPHWITYSKKWMDSTFHFVLFVVPTMASKHVRFNTGIVIFTLLNKMIIWNLYWVSNKNLIIIPLVMTFQELFQNTTGTVKIVVVLPRVIFTMVGNIKSITILISLLVEFFVTRITAKCSRSSPLILRFFYFIKSVMCEYPLIPQCQWTSRADDSTFSLVWSLFEKRNKQPH